MTPLLVLLSALANVMGGLLVVARKAWSHRAMGGMLGFSAGFLLAIAILDLIPESLEMDESNAFLILLGLLSVYFLGLFSSGHHHGEASLHHAHPAPRAGAGLFVGMLIHTFFDGASIVAAFDIDVEIGVLVFFAVILHKIPDGLTVASMVLASTRKRNRALWASLALGASTLLGALAMAALLSMDVQWNQEQIAAMALAFSAGAFLYVAVGDVLPEIHHENKTLSTITVVMGILVYFLTTSLFSLGGMIHHH
jgi:ZIP family zinc transporter/zinc and cadmium transporter